MAKVALDLEHAVTRRHVDGTTAGLGWRELAGGDGWSVSDVICTAGPRERAFEEQHAATSIAVVLAGTFQYRSTPGRELLSPGSLMLGNEGQRYECAHDHGTLRADGVHDDLEVVYPALKHRDLADAVGEAGATLVEQDHTRERREPIEEARRRGLLPPVLDIRHEARHEEEIAWPIAHRLVRDVDAVGLRVAGLGRHNR